MKYNFEIRCSTRVALKFVDRAFHPAVSVMPLLFAGDQLNSVYEKLDKVAEIIDGNFFSLFLTDIPELNNGHNFAFEYYSRRQESRCMFDGDILHVGFNSRSGLMKTNEEYIKLFDEIGINNPNFINAHFPLFVGD